MCLSGRPHNVGGGDDVDYVDNVDGRDGVEVSFKW